MKACIEQTIQELKGRVTILQNMIAALESLDDRLAAASPSLTPPPRTEPKVKSTHKTRKSKAPTTSYSDALKAHDRDEETCSEEPVETAPETPRAAPTDNDNRNADPLSPEGIRIGRSLGQPFGHLDLRARLDGSADRGYRWVAAWKQKGWIDTCGYGQYRRTETFGQ